MSQYCLLLQGLAAFAARVVVSDTSCHFHCSSPVPESAPDIPPQEMLLHSLMKGGQKFKNQFKAQHWSEKKKQPCNGSLLRSVLNLILAEQGWQKLPISLCHSRACDSHAGNEFPFAWRAQTPRQQLGVKEIQLLRNGNGSVAVCWAGGGAFNATWGI